MPIEPPSFEDIYKDTSKDFEIPPRANALINKLKDIHGVVRASRESSGIHLYMPSPIVLEKEGKVELSKLHLSLNLEKHLAFGKWAHTVGSMDHDRVALCHKTGTRYSVSDLLTMARIEERGIVDVIRSDKVHINETVLVDDGRGNKIPPHPGTVQSILDLEEDHPARTYLIDRGFDLESMYGQFRTSYCHHEAPEDFVIGRYYRRMPEGWKDTPQGRIIFYGDVYGVQRIWQSRIIERVVSGPDANLDYRECWHPYRMVWVVTDTRPKGTSKWEPCEAYMGNDRNGNPMWPSMSRYKTAKGASRANAVMGFDAALSSIKKSGKSTVIMCEGPLDAAKFGPPAVAILGKYTNQGQAKMISQIASKVVLAFDSDESGREAVVKARQMFPTNVDVSVMDIPEKYADPGEIPIEEARELAKSVL